MTLRAKITDVRVFLVSSAGNGGDYFQQGQGHWLVDTLIANPMSGYPQYKASRSSWGIGVLGSIVVEIETDEAKHVLDGRADGTKFFEDEWEGEGRMRRKDEG